MESLRIVLTVTAASPELYTALKTTPSRLRAERVRTLATLGIAAVSGVGMSQPSGVETAPPNPLPSPARSNLALSFAKRLGEGM